MKTNILFAMVLILAGAAMIAWGYNVSQTLGSQFTQAFSGTPSNKAMWLYGIGIALALLGVWQFRRK